MSRVTVVPNEVISRISDDDNELEVINNRVSLIGLRRGDLIHLECNNSRYLFDGEKFIDLYRDIDRRGSVHPSFQVISEFPILYWSKAISHNPIIFYSMTTGQVTEALTNLRWLSVYYGLTKFKRGRTEYDVCIICDLFEGTDSQFLGVRERLVSERLTVGQFGWTSIVAPAGVQLPAPSQTTLFLDIWG